MQAVQFMDSTATLLRVVRDCGLVEPEKLDQLDAAGFRDPKAVAHEMMQRGWLTPYQANLLVQGRADELTLGPYVLLERLGEGGMGQVFKARQARLDRVGALKVIRKERLANPSAARRFQREVKATASRNGKLVSWNPATGTQVEDWQLPGPCNGVAYAADGRHLATANASHTVYLFRLKSPPD